MNLNLSEEHDLQVQGYLRFSKLKRDQHVRETIATISDFKDDRVIPGEMYNYQEMDSLFNGLSESVREMVDKEIQNAYHTNALLIKILLSQAQAQGVELIVDTAQLENEFLIKQIGATETTALNRPASDFIRRNAQLGRIGTVATVATQDPALIKERDNLKEESVVLKDRLTKMQEEVTKVMRERSSLNSTVNTLKDDLDSLKSELESVKKTKNSEVESLRVELESKAALGAKAAKASVGSEEDSKKILDLTANLSKLEEDLKMANKQIGVKEKELRDARGALDGKLDGSPQFQQLKQLMQAKNAELVALKRKLNKYEPQDIPNAE
mmetsp:Transcript_8024/g.15585  ORF Transcript_8024/g.15585 Transcript_8024/m.15585 type:complete len:326 (-) Transcript_8024:543-1520(-)